MLRPYNSEATLRKPHRLIRANVLKARREGSSTYISSRGFKRFHLRPNVKGLTVAHTGDSVNAIFRMSKVYYKELPTEFRPEEKHNNGTMLELANTYSLWQIQKAGEVDTSRSKGCSFMHCSELAFWQNAVDAMVSLKQTMGEFDGTEWWNETTPNGEGGIGAYFYDIWRDTKRGETDFINIFFRWFDFDVYTRPFLNEHVEKAEFVNSVESRKDVEKYGEEEKIMKLYDLTWEQMNWRRWYIRNKTEGLNKFMQEYPEDDESCFLTTSNTFFSIAIVNNIKKQCKEPERGDLVWLDEKRNAVKFLPSKTGFLRVWQKPDNLSYENRYAMGWDVSLGVEDGDPTCGEMLDLINPLEKVNILEWHGYLRSDLVAEELLKIHFWYGNNVWHCIEQNGEGDALINFIRDRCSYLYQTITFGKFGEEPTENIGFKMNAKTKGIVIPAFRTALEDNTIVTRNEALIDECRTFTKGEVYKDTRIGFGQKLKAENKGRIGKRRRYDDRIIAGALANEMARIMSPVTEDYTKEPAWARKLKAQRYRGTSYMGV